MADFNQPVLSSLYSDMLNILKERDKEALIWMEGSTNTNLPLNAKRWNSSNNYFEKFNGTSWVALTTKYNIDVEKIDGCTVNDLGTAVTDLWTASKISTELSAKLNSSSYTAADILTKLKTVDGASSGLDADLLDGLHASSTNAVNSIVARDASGNFSAGTITATLSGNASSATTLSGLTSTVAELNFVGGVTSNVQTQLNAKLGRADTATTAISATTATTATNVLGGKATVYGTGNDYYLGGVEVCGNGPANTVFPTIGFHQPSSYASSLQLRGSSDFRFYAQGGGSYANVTANAFIGNLSGNANTAGYATTAGRAYPRRSDGADLNFYWSGQGGQPPWLWGGNDGVNMYVYNPSNFSVNYANSAGSVSASAVASGTAGIGTGAVGSYAFMEYIDVTILEAGATLAGSTLRYSCVSGTYKSSASTVISGTWRAMGRVREGYLTLWLRIA